MKRIYLSSPDVGPREQAGLLAGFDSGYITSLGPELDAFEHEMARWCDRRYAVGLASGTAALHLGLLALRVPAGSYVLTSTMTFAATANAIVHAGAVPVFVDCDETGNLDPELARRACEALLEQGLPVSAVLPVDLLGKVADYEAIQAWASDLGLPVFADAAEGLGATRHGRPAGSQGVAAALSFNGNKVLTTSGGGMLVTDDEQLAAHARKLATQAREPVPWYEHTEIGYNYRLSNLLAGLGRAQLARLPQMLARRREIRDFYRRVWAGVEGVEVFGGGSDAEDSCWLTSIVVDPERAGWTPTQLIDHLDADAIEARRLWKPMHLQPVYAGHRYVARDRDPRGGVSARLFARGVTLPSGSVLTDADLDRIAASLAAFLERR